MFHNFYLEGVYIARSRSGIHHERSYLFMSDVKPFVCHDYKFCCICPVMSKSWLSSLSLVAVTYQHQDKSIHNINASLKCLSCWAVHRNTTLIPIMFLNSDSCVCTSLFFFSGTLVNSKPKQFYLKY